MNETLKSIYNSLSDSQKEKAKACKTQEELIELAAKEGIELPDEMLDSTIGGIMSHLPPCSDKKC